MRTLISGFLHQKSDRQPFFDYVASEAEKMSQEEFKDLKGRIFRDIESIKSNHRAASSVAIQSGRVFDLPGPFQGHQIFQKQLFSCKLFKSPSQNKTKKQYKYLSQEKKKAQHLHHPKHKITHGNTLNKNKATYKKILINELQSWPIICPFVT